jgi:hypothetical protein
MRVTWAPTPRGGGSLTGQTHDETRGKDMPRSQPCHGVDKCPQGVLVRVDDRVLVTEQDEGADSCDEGHEQGERGHTGGELWSDGQSCPAQRDARGERLSTTHEEEPGHVGARLETDTDHADEVHTPHSDGGEARRGETEEEVVSQTSGTRPSAKKEECRIGTEDGDDDREDEDAWERADGDSPVRVVRDELDGICDRQPESFMGCVRGRFRSPFQIS